MARKYEPNPNRKDRCQCFPKPFFGDVEITKTWTETKTERTCQKCGLPITRETIVEAVRNLEISRQDTR